MYRQEVEENAISTGQKLENIHVLHVYTNKN